MVHFPSSGIGCSAFRLPGRSFVSSGSIVLLFAAAQLLVPGCSSHGAKFSSPVDAAAALAQAVRSGNQDEMRRVLGREGVDIVSSGDDVADRQAREKFLQSYDQKNALVTELNGSVMLQVGEDGWPLPIPIVQRGKHWRFDTKAGKEEILNRRVGRNELYVQQVCLAIVDAQREYYSVDRNGDGIKEYAQKLISDAGQRNGLYWEAGPDEAASPLGPLVAEAAAEGYGGARRSDGERRPYHGYYFKLLTSQGENAPGGPRDYSVDGKLTEGFAIVAWPADYGNSGIMTFLVSHHGIVFESDLGRRTDRTAGTMTAFDPDRDWKLSE